MTPNVERMKRSFQKAQNFELNNKLIIKIMTKKDKLQKLEIAQKISEKASECFFAMYMIEVQSDGLKEEFIDKLWNMSLKDIAKMLDQIASIPEDCKEILK